METNEKINIAELLEDCPSGTKLYSPIFGDVYLEKVRPHLAVVVTTGSNDKEEFLYDGRYGINGECVLFPSKENRDWSTFQIPFKDGDILFVESVYNWIFIYKESENNENLYKYAAILGSNHSRLIYCNNPLCCKNDVSKIRLATKEEKQKLFDVIKENGYKWNAETKTLEELFFPKFKVGDVIQDEDGYKVRITEVNLEDECYGYESMIAKGIGSIGFSEQDNYEFVPNKFDITTLKPFESRVLFRENKFQKWGPAIWGYYDIDNQYYPHKLVGGYCTRYCIPYEENEHLLGTSNDCSDFYKTWE